MPKKPTSAYTREFTDAAKSIIVGLELLGFDIKSDDNFQETPRRFAAAMQEFISPKWVIDKEVKKICSVTFDAKYDEMVATSGIRVYSLCPHHLLPVKYNVCVAYIPNKKVLGLSKVVRLARILSKRAVLQEDYTNDVAQVLFENLQPLGTGVVVRGEHACMRMRGVSEQSSEVTTSSLKGVFLTNPSTKTEFLRLME